MRAHWRLARAFGTWSCALGLVVAALASGCKKSGGWRGGPFTSGKDPVDIEFSGELRASEEEVSEAGLLCWRALTYDRAWAARASLLPNPQIIRSKPGPGGGVFWRIKLSRLAGKAEHAEYAGAKRTFAELMKEWLEKRCEHTKKAEKEGLSGK